MIDPDLQKQLVEINTNLIEIKKSSKSGIWRAFFNGMFGALGYVVGILIIVVILGWTLEKVGLLKPLQDQLKNVANLIQNEQAIFKGFNPNSTENQKGNTTNTEVQSGSVGGGTSSQATVNLPDGQHLQLNLPAGFGQ